MSSQEESYQIHLPQFEGPFDLLLFFIERDELDIYDIPVSQITKDFLDYLQQLKTMNIEVASEFILMASTLMHIKAKMLLPRPVLNDAGEIVDPRKELVERLLEYKRYKTVLEEIQKLETEAQLIRKRGFSKEEQKSFLESLSTEQELDGITLFTLLKTFKKVLERYHNQLEKPKHVIQPFPYSMEEARLNIHRAVHSRGRVDFISLILEFPNKYYAVVCFLALLEMIQLNLIKLMIGEGNNNFWIEPQLAES